MTEKMVKKANHSQHTDPQETRYPHFVKLILQSAIEDEKMIIPPKFVKNFGDTLSDVAELALPDGCIWQVGLKKESESIYFDNNWHEFVEHHSIRVGYMLLFSYKGISNFNVLIFDHSYCEIHKHLKPVASMMLVIKEEVDVSSKHDLPERKFIENGEKNSIVVLDKNKGREEIITSENVRSKRAKVSLQTNGAIEAANMFKPRNPSFMVDLKPYNITKYLYVRTGFTTAYLRGVSGSIRIENPEGRGWLVKVIRKPNNSLMLTAGWSAFVRDNDLHTGDVCVFELIERKKAAFKVSKFQELPSWPNIESNEHYMITAAPEEMLNLKLEKHVYLEKKRKIRKGLNQGKSIAFGISGSSKFDEKQLSYCEKIPPTLQRRYLKEVL